MPKFDNDDDWFANVNNVEVLQMFCPHQGAKCSSGYGYKITYDCKLAQKQKSNEQRFALAAMYHAKQPNCFSNIPMDVIQYIGEML